MLKHPERWPHGYVLPLIKNGPISNLDSELGMIFNNVYDESPKRWRVFIGNLCQLQMDKCMTMPSVQFHSAEELYEAGWRVD